MHIRPGLEEDPVMNQELRDAFDDIKSDMKEHHTETRGKISEFGQALNKHMLEDALVAQELKRHLETEEKLKKWRVAVWLAAITATFAALAEAILHHMVKG